MRGDGNCQFRAIALGRYGDEERHAEVRKDAVKYLRENPAILETAGHNGMILIEENGITYEVPFDEYLDGMDEDKCWGDDMTLVAAVRSLGRDIVVVTVNPVGVVTHAQRYYANGGDDRASILAAHRDYDENTLVLGYIQNAHYVVLRTGTARTGKRPRRSK